jgi:hypothetical protein
MGVLMCVHIIIIKIYQVDRYKMIVIHTFQIENFLKFMDVANTSYKIIQEWMIHLNDGIKHLTFCIIGQFYTVHFVNSLISIHSTITQKGFHQTIRTIKIQCIVV